MSGIFISYRKEDSLPHANRLYDDLKNHFGPSQVFMDLSTLAPGVEFDDEIKKAAGSSDVLIAFIGRRWLTTTNANGQARLNDPEDYVRLEIQTALDRNIPVIPVLVQGATMPAPENLPEALVKLVEYQWHEITDSRWKYDVEQLVKTLGKMPGLAAKETATKVAGVAGVAAGLGGAHVLAHFIWMPLAFGFLPGMVIYGGAALAGRYVARKIAKSLT